MPILFIALPHLCAHNRRQGGLFVSVSRKGPLLQEPCHKLLFFHSTIGLDTLSTSLRTDLSRSDSCVVFLVMALELHVLGHRCGGALALFPLLHTRAPVAPGGELPGPRMRHRFSILRGPGRSPSAQRYQHAPSRGPKLRLPPDLLLSVLPRFKTLPTGWMKTSFSDY